MNAQSFDWWQSVRQRLLVRAVAYYLAGAWLALQLADLVGNVWQLPEIALQGLFVIAILGLPIAAMVGWLGLPFTHNKMLNI